MDVNNSRPTLGLHPTFADLDGDSDMDMILGDYNGFLHYFTNTAGSGNTAVFALTDPEYLQIDVGNDATPLLHDIDNDGLKDLLIGKKAGTFSYYKNSGTTSIPNFSLVTTSFGNVTTKRTSDISGNSNPVIIDSAGTTQLFSGSKSGNIYKFGNIDGNLTGTFSVNNKVEQIWEGINSIVSITDINNDNLLDMVIGNQSGGLTYYDGSATVGIIEINSISEINLYPNPTNGIINIDLGNNNLNNATIQIIDLLGKVIQTEHTTSKKTTINLSKYSKGIYLVKFSNQKGSKVYKVIKE